MVSIAAFNLLVGLYEENKGDFLFSFILIRFKDVIFKSISFITFIKMAISFQENEELGEKTEFTTVTTGAFRIN